MWSDNIKLWIVLTIFHTGKSQYAEYYGDPGGIMFPGPVQSSYNQNIKYNPQPSACTNCQSSISKLKIAKELEAIETVEDFFNFMSNKPGAGRELLLSKRFDDENERSNVYTPTPERCKPDMKLVPFRNKNTKPSITYWPPCTRIERCDGCCNTDLWSCQAINQTMVNFRVFKYEINERGDIDFHGDETIPLEKHTNCQCLCKVKANHCSLKQQYVEKNCKCECANHDEMEKCHANHSTHIWNPDKCECNCRKNSDCNSGYHFDYETCSCAKDPNYSNTQKYYSEQMQTKNNLAFKSAVTLPSAKDPRRKHKDEAQ